MSFPYMVRKVIQVCQWIGCGERASQVVYDEQQEKVGEFCYSHGLSELREMDES